MKPPLRVTQKRCLDDLLPMIETGARVCVEGATGSGKTRIMTELLELGAPTVLYTNRRMLLDQTSNVLQEEGFRFGVRAAGIEPNLDAPIQLASVQTESSRVLRMHKRGVHPADLVLIDELHLNKADEMQKLLEKHQNYSLIGFTATPVGIDHMVDSMVSCGSKKELREIGALIPAHTYAPDMPDMSKIRREVSGEFKYGDIVKKIMTQSLIGRLTENLRRYNEDLKPTLVFACGKPESLWIAQKMTEAGIRSAHIDGDEVWLDGEFYPSSRDMREEVARQSESGELPVVCNRFVMREGIDWPWLYCGVFATVFGAYSSFIQSGGRILRAHPSMDHCVIIDHGGNYHRFGRWGSINRDYHWELGMTDYRIGAKITRNLRTKKEPEPIICPVCFAPRLSGPICHSCGHQSHGKSRMVVERDGRLVEQRGDIYKRPRIYRSQDAQKKWERCFYRCEHADRTFNQVRGLFQYENYGMEPPQGLAMMPKYDEDWFLKVKDVPQDRLTNG